MADDVSIQPGITGDDRLLLRAEEAVDMPPLSALVQDAVVAATDVVFDHKARRLVLLISRYRWEAEVRSRVRSALRIESVLHVERRRWPRDPAAVLDLLAMTALEDVMTLDFAGGAAIRVRVECIDAVLEDMSQPWPVQHRPGHD